LSLTQNQYLKKISMSTKYQHRDSLNPYKSIDLWSIILIHLLLRNKLRLRYHP